MNFDEKSYEFISKLVNIYRLPKMARVHQSFDATMIEDIPGAVKAQLERPEIRTVISSFRKGERIAITAGSRQVRNLALIIRTVVDHLKALEMRPFIIPSMGSHGGATAEGQKAMIASYGITEASMGCPILSDMTTVEIGKTADGKSVCIDRNAYEADHIIVLNRIKPHTCFRGPYESGLMKMMAIGLGKQHGAELCHDDGFGNMARNIENFGRVIMDRANIALGIGLVENAYDQTCIIRALTPDQIISEEPKLLEEARSRMPRIALPECDVLIVDSMGKNFSGSGMDPNVTGRFVTKYAHGGINAQRMAVLDLSEESHGNCIGVGCADVTTKRLYDKAIPAYAYINGFTSLVINGTKMPVVMMNDREAIGACLRTCTGIDRNDARIIRIPNTLNLSEIMVSEALKDEVDANPALEFESEFEEMQFDGENNLRPFSSR